jgi:hypothetical protein
MKLNVDSTVESPALPSVLAYLRSRQWLAVVQDSPQWAVFQRNADGQTEEVDVPLTVSARDYPLRMRELIEALVAIEKRAPAEIVRDIAASSSDIVRIAIAGSTTRDGRIPMAAGGRVYSAVRDMMLAAACSVVEPRAAYAKRKPEEAMKLLERARFGQTEVGSFVVTIECSVAPALQHNLLQGDDFDAPMERKATRRLASGLAATQRAVLESLTSSGIEAFQQRTRDGVSANLCDAVAEILEATSADRVTTSFAFAASRPIAQATPSSVAFGADDAGTLREAANRMRATASYPGIELQGPVFKLQREGADSGEVVISASVEGKLRNVHMELNRDDYQTAVAAHRDSTFVRCQGNLQRDGRTWVLQNVLDFGAIDADAEDR